MKKFIYLFALIALSVGLTCAQAASPTYDDNPPPSYIWGEGEINSQTSGTPNKTGEQKIVDAINNMDIGVGSISVDTSNIESYLKEVDGEETITITDLINGIGTDTKNIENQLKVDDKTIAELINGIGTDTSNIESHLKADTGSSVIKTVGEMLVPIFKMFYDGGDGSTSAFGLLCNDVSHIIPLLTDSSPTGTTISDKLKQIESKTGAVLDSIAPKYYRTQRISNISANTATIITGITPTDANDYGSIRIFIELRAIDPDAEFYIGFDGNVSDSTGRPVKGRILLNMSNSQPLYVYHTNASAIAVQQTEGWR